MTEDYPMEAIVNGLMISRVRPAEESIAAAPELHDWSFEVNELTGIVVFTGRGKGHPSIADGKLLHTSRVRYVDADFLFIVTSNRIYRLGLPSPRG